MTRRAEGGAFAAGVVWPSLLSETREAEPRGREGAARSRPATGMLSSRPCTPGPSKSPGPRAPQSRSRAGPGLCPDAQAALVLSCGLVRRRTQPGLPAVSPPPPAPPFHSAAPGWGEPFRGHQSRRRGSPPRCPGFACQPGVGCSKHRRPWPRGPAAHKGSWARRSRDAESGSRSQEELKLELEPSLCFIASLSLIRKQKGGCLCPWRGPLRLCLCREPSDGHAS